MRYCTLRPSKSVNVLIDTNSPFEPSWMQCNAGAASPELQLPGSRSQAVELSSASVFRSRARAKSLHDNVYKFVRDDDDLDDLFAV